MSSLDAQAVLDVIDHWWETSGSFVEPRQAFATACFFQWVRERRTPEQLMEALRQQQAATQKEEIKSLYAQFFYEVAQRTHELESAVSFDLTEGPPPSS